jgi:catechol 2,3-dioxygenase-like lactoylglutathione lyase family enzyme
LPVASAKLGVRESVITGEIIMANVGYVCIGTNDFDRATGFYDALLGEVGGKRLMPTPNGLLYQVGKGAMVMITRPHNKELATAGNGSMLAIKVDSDEQVASLHAKALALGATCEGAPGPRGGFGHFAYFRDLDGNKLAAFHTAG